MVELSKSKDSFKSRLAQVAGWSQAWVYIQNELKLCESAVNYLALTELYQPHIKTQAYRPPIDLG